MADRVGQHIDDYRLIRLLGTGSFGEVYLGEHLESQTPAAVKMLNLSQENLKAFVKEASTAFRLKHPHIIGSLAFGMSADDTPYLIMDYASNGTLRQRHPKGTCLSLDTIVSYLLPLAEALQYAHDRRVIHRDVKPDNVLIGQNGELLLSDFGIAVIAPLEKSLSTQNEAGTSPYMAPEQIRRKPQPASDQYALGIMAYEWLCGVRPFDGASYTEIAIRHLMDPPPPLQQRGAAILMEVEQVVLRALAKDPQERFPGVLDFATALQEAGHIGESSPPPSSSSLPLAPSPTGVLPQLGQTSDNSAVVPPVVVASQLSMPPSTYPESFITKDLVTHFISTSPINTQKPVLVSNKCIRRKHRLIAPIIALILVVLLSMGTLGYQAFQASVLATITVSPRVQTISTVFRLTAKLGLKGVSAASSSIPAGAFTSTQESSQQGETTGVTHCLFDIIDCQQVVSLSDIEMLSSQIQPTLRSKINQDLQKQAHDANAMMIGNTMYSNEIVTPNPSAGTASKTVTVTMTEQGSTEYIKAKDVNDLAILLLKQKLNPHDQLIDSLVQIGQPVVQQVNTDGTAQIAIAAGGVARYQMPASELADIRNHIKGLSQNNAHAQIAKDANINPNTHGSLIFWSNLLGKPNAIAEYLPFSHEQTGLCVGFIRN